MFKGYQVYLYFGGWLGIVIYFVRYFDLLLFFVMMCNDVFNDKVFEVFNEVCEVVFNIIIKIEQWIIFNDLLKVKFLF